MRHLLRLQASSDDTCWCRLILIATAGGAPAQADDVLEIDLRGQKIRALLLKPGTRPCWQRHSARRRARHARSRTPTAGSDRGAGAFDQLVRTRAAYAQAGYRPTPVPDFAPDLQDRDRRVRPLSLERAARP